MSLKFSYKNTIKMFVQNIYQVEIKCEKTKKKLENLTLLYRLYIRYRLVSLSKCLLYIYVCFHFIVYTNVKVLITSPQVDNIASYFNFTLELGIVAILFELRNKTIK